MSNVQYCRGKYVLLLPQQSIEDAELVELLKDVLEVTVLVSVALFNGLSVSMSLPKPSCSWLAKKMKKVKLDEGIEEFSKMGMLRKKMETEEVKMVSKQMHELEDCIGGIEICGQKVFRSLINARVSLLNVYTQ